MTRTPLRLGWFSTGRGPGSRRLLAAAHDAVRTGDLPAAISFVFCNRERGEFEPTDGFLDQVEGYGLPLVTLSFRRLRREWADPPDWRPRYDREAMRLLEPYPVDLVVLAGYMLIASEEMCRRYAILNLHPAAPGGPQGTWQEVIWRLIAQRAPETGVLVHLATPDVDQGPPVAYCRFPLRGGAFDPLWRALEGVPVDRLQADEGEDNALFRLIRQEGVRREVPLLIATLRACATGKVRIAGHRALDAAGRPIPGRDLTEEIEALVRAGAS